MGPIKLLGSAGAPQVLRESGLRLRGGGLSAPRVFASAGRAVANLRQFLALNVYNQSASRDLEVEVSGLERPFNHGASILPSLCFPHVPCAV